MFFQCNIISAFWITFQQWWYERTHWTFELGECNVIYGWYDTQFKDVLNYGTLVAKYLIFCCFQDTTAVTFDRFPHFLRNKIDTLRQTTLKNKQLEESRFPFWFICFLLTFTHSLIFYLFNPFFFSFNGYNANPITYKSRNCYTLLYLSFILYYYITLLYIYKREMWKYLKRDNHY